MNIKFIGFPIKDGCHVNGADKGINVIKNYIPFEKIINIKKYNTDLETIVKNDLTLAQYISNLQKQNFLPITIGGDHSLTMGSIAGSAENNNNLGVIWLDTHPDINTHKTTTTYNIHGYPLAASMGFGLKDLTDLYINKTKVNYENVVLFGINDIDEPEQKLINEYNIKCFTLENINKYGIEKCITEAINYLKERTNNIHLSFDLDAINYSECPGVNVPNRWKKGIKEKDALLAVKSFLKNLNIVSMDIVEYNPLNDINDKTLNIVLETKEVIDFSNNPKKSRK